MERCWLKIYLEVDRTKKDIKRNKKFLKNQEKDIQCEYVQGHKLKIFL